MGFLDTLLGGLLSGIQQGSQNAFNANEAKKQRYFQSREAEITRAFNSSESALQREWSSQEAERARDWQEEMNEKYNSISGKISQAEQAGVNPMFAVTGNAVSPASASGSVPSGSAASAGMPSGASATGSFVDLVGNILGLSKLKAEVANIEADTRSKNASSDYTSWLSKLSEREYKIITENNFDVQKLESEIGLNHDQALFAFQSAGKVFEEAGKIAEEKRFLVDTADDREKIVEYEKLIKEFESSISSTLEVLDGDKKAELSDVVGAILKAIFAIKK